MAESATKTRRIEQPGFDVTCVIGHVTFGEGDVSPEEAAFALIGRHNAEGIYSFPRERGGTVTVEVTHEIPM